VVPEARLNVATYLRRWLKTDRERVRPSTHLVRVGHVENHIVPELGRTNLKRLVPVDVERMTGAMVRHGLSPRTASHVRTTLRIALRDAERNGLVSRNAAALARPPKVEKAEATVLTADQTRILLATTRQDRRGPLWALLSTSGLRLGEALALTWSDLDLEEGVVHVRQNYALVGRGKWAVGPTKTSRSRRDVPLPHQTVEVLGDWRDRQAQERQAAGRDWQQHADGDPVFADEWGRRPEPTRLNHDLRAALLAAGLPRTRIHDLRHSYASQLLLGGVPLLTVSRLLGHSGISITADVYSHVGTAMTRDAAGVLGALLEGPAR
jgi:integrase